MKRAFARKFNRILVPGQYAKRKLVRETAAMFPLGPILGIGRMSGIAHLGGTPTNVQPAAILFIRRDLAVFGALEARLRR